MLCTQVSQILPTDLHLDKLLVLTIISLADLLSRSSWGKSLEEERSEFDSNRRMKFETLTLERARAGGTYLVSPPPLPAITAWESQPEAPAHRRTTASAWEEDPNHRSARGLGHRSKTARWWHARTKVSAHTGDGARSGASSSGEPHRPPLLGREERGRRR